MLTGLDWEATGATNGTNANPFNPNNRGVCLSLVTTRSRTTYSFEYYDYHPYLTDVPLVQQQVDDASVICMMNAKYDYHWCRRYGINLRNKKIWDVQVFHFILMRQTVPYPSLNSIAEYYGLEQKLDVVKRDYWEQGLDTDQVPFDILQEYCEHDTWLTLRIAQEQMYYMRYHMDEKQKALVRAAMYDIHNLAEMEWEGFKYDHTLSSKLAQETEGKTRELEEQIREALGINDFPTAVSNTVNLASNDHLSALLYGGVIKYVEEEKYIFTYADKRKGSVEKTRKVQREWECPRLVTPLPKSELAKAGCYSTNEDTLRKLKTNKRMKQVIDMLLELSKLQKLNGTYFLGFPKLLEKMSWGDVIHISFNQCVAATGRLSSNKPNMQNVPPPHKPCFISQFEEEFDVTLPKGMG